MRQDEMGIYLIHCFNLILFWFGYKKGHPKVSFSKRLVELAGVAFNCLKKQGLQYVRLFVIYVNNPLVPYLSTICR